MLPPSLSKADLHLLYVFSTVVEARGFAAAQIELNVSASTISRQITDLEIRLGRKLCQRGRSGFLVTEEGEQVYAAAQRLFASVREFTETVHSGRGRMAGSLSVAAIDNWVLNRASPFSCALQELVETAPDVTIELFALAPNDIEIAVNESRVALGLGVFHRQRPGLVYDALDTETMSLCCGAGHPLFDERDPKRVQEGLAASLYAKRSYLREKEVAPVSRGLRANARAHQIEGIAQLVLTGRYIGYLPDYVAQVWVERGEMRIVGEGQYDQRSEISLVRKRGARPSQVVRAFEAMLKRHAARTGA